MACRPFGAKPLSKPMLVYCEHDYQGIHFSEKLIKGNDLKHICMFTKLYIDQTKPILSWDPEAHRCDYVHIYSTFPCVDSQALGSRVRCGFYVIVAVCVFPDSKDHGVDMYLTSIWRESVGSMAVDVCYLRWNMYSVLYWFMLVLWPVFYQISFTLITQSCITGTIWFSQSQRSKD